MMTQKSKRRPASPKQAAACCRPIDGLLDPGLFRALCDPTRVALLACIAKCGRPCSVGEVTESSSVDLSVVSRHLALLSKAGVLTAEKKGRTMFYSVQYGHLCTALRTLADAFEECCPDDGVKSEGACFGKC
jgi:ArsR family transcriptional regulator